MSYGYTSALEAAGCEILEFKEFGSYQGEWLACVNYNGEIGVVEGWYGSCSGCDAFQSEFDWDSEETPDYEERLASFGESYLPTLPFEHYITQYTQRIKDNEWDNEVKEMLETITNWKNQYMGE